MRDCAPSGAFAGEAPEVPANHLTGSNVWLIY